MIIAAPVRRYRRPRLWRTFETLFEPVPRSDCSLLWDHADIDWTTVGPRTIWTVVEGDRGGLYVVAGIHVVNRIGFLVCEHAWGGDWTDHPDYHYL